jgi:hypothetical protein
VCGRKKFTWHKYHLLEDQATGSVSTQCLATGPINWSIGLTLISTFSCKELAYSDPPMAISTHESVKRWNAILKNPCKMISVSWQPWCALLLWRIEITIAANKNSEVCSYIQRNSLKIQSISTVPQNINRLASPIWIWTWKQCTEI